MAKERPTMSEKAKEARRRYKRAWNAANPDKVRAAQERFWMKKAAEIEAAREREPDPAAAQ